MTEKYNVKKQLPRSLQLIVKLLNSKVHRTTGMEPLKLRKWINKIYSQYSLQSN